MKKFKVKRAFTLKGKPVKAGDVVDGTREDFRVLMNKGYVEMITQEQAPRKAEKTEKITAGNPGSCS